MQKQFETGTPSGQQNGTTPTTTQQGQADEHHRQSLWRPRELQQSLHDVQAAAAISDVHSLDNDLRNMK